MWCMHTQRTYNTLQNMSTYIPWRHEWRGDNIKVRSRRGHKVAHICQSKLNRIPQLVAELTITYYTLDVEVDVATLTV